MAVDLIGTWRDRALCKETDLDFVPILTGLSVAVQREQARTQIAVCEVCPVKTECLHHAIEQREERGIWGGLLPRERQRILRSEPTPDERCGTEAGFAAHRRRNERPCGPCQRDNVTVTKQRKASA